MESFRQILFLSAQSEFFCVGGEDLAMLSVRQQNVPPCLKELSVLSYLVVLAATLLLNDMLIPGLISEVLLFYCLPEGMIEG